MTPHVSTLPTPGSKNGEVVATKTGHRVDVTGCAYQPVAHDLQQLIALGVPETVVDLLERVEVEHHHGELLAIAPAAVAAWATWSLNSTWFGRPVSASTSPARGSRPPRSGFCSAEEPTAASASGGRRASDPGADARTGVADDQPLAVQSERVFGVPHSSAEGGLRAMRVLAAQKLRSRRQHACSTSSASTKPWISTKLRTDLAFARGPASPRRCCPRKSCKPMSSRDRQERSPRRRQTGDPGEEADRDQERRATEAIGQQFSQCRDEGIVQCEPEVPRQQRHVGHPQHESADRHRDEKDSTATPLRRSARLLRPPPRPRGR